MPPGSCRAVRGAEIFLTTQAAVQQVEETACCGEDCQSPQRPRWQFTLRCGAGAGARIRIFGNIHEVPIAIGVGELILRRVVREDG